MSDTTAYVNVADAAELTGYSVKYIRKLVKSRQVDYVEEQGILKIAWSDVKRLASHYKPFWVTLPDTALQLDLPDPSLLLHEHSEKSEGSQIPSEFIDGVQTGHCLDWIRQMPSSIIQSVVTSPPYWGVRKYPGEIRVKWSDGSSFDLDDDLDKGVPEVPGHLLYLYYPFEDKEELPDLERLHALARLGAHMIEQGNSVLAHCGMGHNRSALLAGIILTYLGMTGEDAVTLLRQKRQGALYNKTFASYVAALPSAHEQDREG